MTVNFHRVRFFGSVCLIFIACQIHAATIAKVAVDITNKDKSTSDTHIITVDVDKVRVDYLDTSGTKSKTTPYILTLDAGMTWDLGNQNEGEFYCAQVNMEDFFKELGEIIAKVDYFVNVTYSDDKVQLISEEPGPEMYGYKTTHMKIQTTANAEAQILFKKFDYSTKKIDEVWFVKDQFFHVAIQRWVQGLTNSGYGELDKLSYRYRELLNGSSLKHESIMEVTNNKKNKTDIYRRNMEVVSIEHVKPGDLPADIFIKAECKSMSEKQLKNAAKSMFKENKVTL